MQGNKLAANESFFVFVNNKIPDGCKFLSKHRIKYGLDIRKIQRRGRVFVHHLPGHGGQRRILIV